MKKQVFKDRMGMYALPYSIMQLEKDLEEKLKEIKKMRTRLFILKKKEMGNTYNGK